MPTSDDNDNRPKTSTRDREHRGIRDFDTPSNNLPSRTTSSNNDRVTSRDDDRVRSPELKRADTSSTRTKTANISPTDDMRRMMSLINMNQDDEIFDYEGYSKKDIDKMNRLMDIIAK